MIATITLNPSVDRRYTVDSFEKGGVFRARETQQTAGGKGLNVARVVKLLGEPVTASGFLGGRNGEFIEEELDRLGIQNCFVKIKGETRSCIAILSDDQSQTEILEQGPEITREEMKGFYRQYDEILRKTDIICASGSLPGNVPVDVYKELITKARKSKVKFILDTSGEALREGIKASPFLIKPNKEELQAIADTEITSEEDMIRCAKKISETGIEVVVVSLGEEGAIVVNSNTLFKVRNPKVKVANPVGSGDSMIAGFAVALERGFGLREMIAFASACGIANAVERETGMIKLNNVKDIENKVVIEEINL